MFKAYIVIYGLVLWFPGGLGMILKLIDAFTVPCLVLCEVEGVSAHVRRSAGMGRTSTGYRGLSMETFNKIYKKLIKSLSVARIFFCISGFGVT